MHNNNLAQAPGPALILLCGLPGAGKTTFALALSSNLSLVHRESDALRRELFPQPSYSAAESTHVFAVLEKRVAEDLAEGRIVLVDATNLREAHRRRFLGLAHHVLAPAVTVRLVAPEVTVLARLAKPRRGHSEAGADVYRSLRSVEDPCSAPCVVVDTRFPLAPSLTLVTELVKSRR